MITDMRGGALRSRLRRNIFNLAGWGSDRKLVVFESDDWGSIRMPSAEVYQILLEKGVPVDRWHYTRYDSLASEKDLEGLFSLLSAFRDKKGNPPVLTANCVVANPDFEKIAASDFRVYHFEKFTDTLSRYPGHGNSFSMMQQARKEKIFFPQSHGREHLNVQRWLKALQRQSDQSRLAFDHRLFGISINSPREQSGSYMAAFDYDHRDEIPEHRGILTEGLKLFRDIFGYASESFIAPNYYWDPSLEEAMEEEGVRYIQGAGIQRSPTGSVPRILRHRLGEKNSRGQRYLVRNCSFEPSLDPSTDWVGACLRDVADAFRFRAPAVIETHRVNFVGYIDPENRERNLGLFKELIGKILQIWPETEFVTSADLGRMIEEN